jgi:ectoine hydroxylase-related dioxygenase (phytanoyl-CoA dioxygenase family)
MDIASQLERRIDVRATINTLKSDGFCFIEALLDQDTVAGLNVEFQKVFDELPLGVSMGTHPPGRMATIDTQTCDAASLPITHSVFMSSKFRIISEAMLSKGSKINDKIVMTHETKVMPISDIHFDSQRALKTLIYLLDTDVGNGATSFCKGSHVENRAYRKEFLSQGGHLMDLQNIVPETELESIDLECVSGPAGSMVIFDTDCWHSGGCLENDTKERRIIRSRSKFAGQPPMRPNRFSPLWFRRRFNIFLPPPPFEIPGRERTRGTSRK